MINRDDIRIAKLVMRWATNGEPYAPAVHHLASVVAEAREREAAPGVASDADVRVILAAVTELTGLNEGGCDG